MPAAAAPAVGREVRNIVRAIAWMLLGGLSFTAMTLLVRASSQAISAFELTFWRALIGCLIMLPVILRGGMSRMRTRRPGAHGLRSVVQYLGIALWFYAVADINLSQGMALQFTVPLFTIAMVAVIFKERVGLFRWAITAVGFAGVLVVLRPGIIEITPVSAIVLVSSIFYASANVVTKSLQRTESSESIVFYMNLMHVPMSLVPALLAWSGPALADWPAIITMAAFGSLAHYCVAQSMRLVPISVIMPVDFMKLPMIAVLAWLFFGEASDPWAWVGGAIIFGATCVLMRRETLRARAAGARASA